MVSRPSLASLLLRTFTNDEFVDQATGFLVEHHHCLYLVTNGHVLSGRARLDGRNLYCSGAWPDEIEVTHLRLRDPIEWATRKWPVRDIYGPLWLSHPQYGRLVDVGVLPLGSVDVIPHANRRKAFVR